MSKNRFHRWSRRKIWRSANRLRKQPAGLQVESLEQRMLLATSPQLLSIQPNVGEVLQPDDVRLVAPRELTFRFDPIQQIDPASLGGIQMTGAGADGTLGTGDDIQVALSRDNSDLDNEVVVRFAKTLPDDVYRIEVFGTGSTPVRNLQGDVFDANPNQEGNQDFQLDFRLNLGTQVAAVVPQPVVAGEGALVQSRDVIEVYFNDNDLDPDSVTDPRFYQLIFTGHANDFGSDVDTVGNLDDGPAVNPMSVVYSAAARKATLTFSAPLDELPTGPGTYRLRIGTSEPTPVAPVVVAPDDAGSSFDTAYDLTALGAQSQIVQAAIDPQPFPLDFPGATDEPGHRDIAPQSHFVFPADRFDGISAISYNFKDNYGTDPAGNALFNLITETQKQRAREIFEIYDNLLGVDFIETDADGFTIVTGDVRVLGATGGPLGVLGVSNPNPGNPFNGMAIMDNAEQWNNEYPAGGTVDELYWFDTAMHEVGHLLGLGHTDELAPFTVMNDERELRFDNIPELMFPGDNDILHGQYTYRPDSIDIDLYRFEVGGEAPGLFTAEISAERLADASLLDSVLRLYREDAGGERTLIAQNDDYFSEDSFLQLGLEPGVYYIGVSASGNDAYEPQVEDTGIGGVSEGPYELRLDFRPEITESIADSPQILPNGETVAPLLDGDGDGRAGGVFNFWFRAAAPSGLEQAGEPKTVFVDKSHTPGPGAKGTLANPFQTIHEALGQNRNGLPAANPDPGSAVVGDILRVVGNGDGSDLTEIQPYEIGSDLLNPALEDGLRLDLPRGVTMMIDAGAVFKMSRAAILVGSTSAGIDKSGAALQVLGIPGRPVYFTSYNDEGIGEDNNPLNTTPAPGDWGGLVFTDELDRPEGRFRYEAQGIFLNYVNEADLRYAGGIVNIGSRAQVVAPVAIRDIRPTVTHNSISLSADAAIGASPNSFEETTFHAPEFQQSSVFTSDYGRVGPDIYGNRLSDNSLNGLMIRLDTPAGGELRTLTVQGRWDDEDIIHIVTDALKIEGTPGGPLGTPVVAPPDAPPQERYDLQARLDGRLAVDPNVIVKLNEARIEVGIGSQLLAEGLPGEQVIFTSLYDDRFGAGGVFDTSQDTTTTTAAPGDWSGLYFFHSAHGSLDHALIAYGGGVSPIEGSFAGFNAIEVHQAWVRVANSSLIDNDSGVGGQGQSGRSGRGNNAPGAIFVQGAQPVLINNTIVGTESGSFLFPAAAVNINAQALNANFISDPGRSTGHVDRLNTADANQGPLIVGTTLEGNDVNGMLVRGATLAQQGVWDDTSIAHVLLDTIYVPDFHTTGGLRLESSPEGSLVVKLGGSAGFTAVGRGLDINDRVGGTLQFVGQPGRPVILTSVVDDTVGAGLTLDGSTQLVTFGAEIPIRTGPSSFDINLLLEDEIAENEGLVNALEEAVTFWERLIQDDVALNFDVTMDDLGGPLGQAGPEIVGIEFDTVVQRMIQDAGAHESFLTQLPTFNEFQAIFPDAPGAEPYSVAPFMPVGLPSAKALGFPAEVLPEIPSEINGDLTRDGSISIDDQYGAGEGDLNQLVFVMIHEIGHALGFISSADDLPEDGGPVAITQLDLFRMAPGAGGIDFTNNPRVFDPDREQVFYDGGQFFPTGISIPGIQQGDIPVSRGGESVDDYQASHWRDNNAPELNGIFLGIMDPAAGTDRVTPNDLRAFDLLGWDISYNWDGIRFEEFANDRNVDVFTELEPLSFATMEGGAADPGGPNGIPTQAEFVGALATGEKTGDDNLRLGFEIHGTLSSPGDVDVYSFDGQAATEVWLDIDRTSSTIDTVVELVDADGNVFARSENSLAETEDDSLLVGSSLVTPLPLQKSAFYATDHFTVNPQDAGLRLLLPGVEGTSSTYYVRVRSDSPDLDGDVYGGVTAGSYELQVRLREVDEASGSVVKFTDIRYATNGITIAGQPYHSPLFGEQGETLVDDVDINDTFETAQAIGNPLRTDRAAIGVTGTLQSKLVDGEATEDIDWFQFDVRWDSLQREGNLAPLVLDIDYADGTGNPNTHLALFNEAGQLIAFGDRSNLFDDQPAPGRGSDFSDLSRGSFGNEDPFLGPVVFPSNTEFDPACGDDVCTYYVAVLPDSLRPQELWEQYFVADPINPLARSWPIDSVTRIGEERFGASVADYPLPSPATPPLTEILLDEEGRLPYFLSDMTLFVTQGSNLWSVNPFTGAVTTFSGALRDVDNAGSGSPDWEVHDIAMRADGDIFGFSFRDLRGGAEPSDETIGNLLRIDNATSLVEALADDGIETYELEVDPDDPMAEPEVVRSNDGNGVGIEFEALSFLNPGIGLYAVGNRSDFGVAMGPEPGQNLVYQLDAVEYPQLDFNNTEPGTAISAGPERADNIDEMMGAFTNIVEIGAFTTQTPRALVTGMASIEGVLYAVDNAGSLYTFDPAAGASTFVAQIDGNPRFAGLTAGPAAAEDELYAQMLFGITEAGDLVAFDISGASQNVFFNGTNRVSTGIDSAFGLAFSTLDDNLWHLTTRRADDAGHGLEDPFTRSVFEEQDDGGGQAGNSFYFGHERAGSLTQEFFAGNNSEPGVEKNDFNFPGGARGTLITSSFDLSAFDNGDTPVLYFNYFLETENPATNATGDDYNTDPNPAHNHRDAFRVYVVDDDPATGDGQWHLLGTNNSFRDTGRLDEFDFVTNGASNNNNSIGENRGYIQELFDSTDNWRQARIPLTAFAGSSNLRLRFEFSSGGALGTFDPRGIADPISGLPLRDPFISGTEIHAVPGWAIQDGDIFVLDADADPETPDLVTFEFDLTDVNPGIADGATAVEITSDASANDVAAAVRSALAGALAGGTLEAFKTFENIVYVFGRVVVDNGPLGYSGAVAGDFYGSVTDSATDYEGVVAALQNEFEGIYIDDLVIGLAERGEFVTGAGAEGNTTLIDNIEVPNGTILDGKYQLEIRGATNYIALSNADGADSESLTGASINSNDRLSQTFSVTAPAGGEITAGQSFTLSDGRDPVVFEFEDATVAEENDNLATAILTDVIPGTADTYVGIGRVGDNNSLVDPSLPGSNAEKRRLDVDLFAIDLAAGDRIGVDVDSTFPIDGSDVLPPGSFLSYLRMFDESGSEVANSMGQVAPGEPPNLDPFMFFEAPGDGRYYIGISGAFIDFLTGDLVPNSAYDPNVSGSGFPSELYQTGEYRLEVEVNGGAAPGDTVPVPYATFDTANRVADRITSVINTDLVREDFGLDMTALTRIASSNVELFGNPVLVDGLPLVIENPTAFFGDANQFRDQGQLIIHSNIITDAVEYGIRVEPSDPALAGTARDLRESNVGRLVPGVTITNNVIVRGGLGGIRYSGNGDPVGPVPYGRIVNNTIVGGSLADEEISSGVGVEVVNRASPTLLNNIFAKLETGVGIDSSSSSTVVAGSLFQDNIDNGVEGDFVIRLQAGEPLFINPETDNYLLQAGSRAIDTGRSSVEDRPGLVLVKDPLGLGISPVLAPERDGLGQLRIDDPTISPAGGGGNSFKDRGALERADFVGPRVELTTPLDNSSLDQDPTATIVELADQTLLSFELQLIDRDIVGSVLNGVGVDDFSVTSDTVTVRRNGQLLLDGSDYSFRYDLTNNVIRLSPLAGIWLPGRYEIRLGDSIVDLSGNVIRPNRGNGSTAFSVILSTSAGDYGDAPTPYPTLIADEGAVHVVGAGLFLGATVDEENDGQPSENADGDGADEDGVVFTSPLTEGDSASLLVTASGSGLLDAWIDFNADGDWNDPDEQVFVGQPLMAGPNNLSLDVPLSAEIGTTYARFRFSSEGGLAPTGLAGDGEVEDYVVEIQDAGIDFGDAPDPSYPTLLANNGARHDIVPGFFLGSAVDAEADGQPSADANGDDGDEDGVALPSAVFLGKTSSVNVNASAPGRLDGWVDFNGDGDWNDAGEQIFVSQSLLAGVNQLTLTVPATATVGPSYARFRFSTAGGLGPAGAATDGEVEDYALAIEAAAQTWHNADDPTDVEGLANGTAPVDAILVINELDIATVSDPVTGLLELPANPPPFYDVNDDGFVSPLDALLVINALPSTSSAPTAALSSGTGPDGRDGVLPLESSSLVGAGQEIAGRVADRQQGQRVTTANDGRAAGSLDVALAELHGDARRTQSRDEMFRRAPREAAAAELAEVDDLFAQWD